MDLICRMDEWWYDLGEMRGRQSGKPRQEARWPSPLQAGWPSGKVSAPGPEGRRLEARFHQRTAVHGACCAPNHTQWPNVLPLVWRGNLKRGCQPRRRPRHLTSVQNYEVRP
ncbi:hypothetical protein AVEN_271602-1 [Araneus ventricosus]|uniref:Uncharacterized protein n=1 Tax=Araneus ventricosus TaxID=182803 RepID=A0A4Y2DLR8_ARAVE|nr:hypothetical protein AVEN_271602-1 [Araneus ventricosus]